MESMDNNGPLLPAKQSFWNGACLSSCKHVWGRGEAWRDQCRQGGGASPGRWRGTAECALQGPQGPESIRAGGAPDQMRHDRYLRRAFQAAPPARRASLARIAGVRRRCPMRARGGRVAVAAGGLARYSALSAACSSRFKVSPSSGKTAMPMDRSGPRARRGGAASAAFRFLATCSAASWPPASSSTTNSSPPKRDSTSSCAARRSCARPRSSAPGRRCRGHRCRSRS